MPYRLKGILKSPNGQPLTGVDLQFIAQQTLTPVLQQTDHNIRLGLDGSYDVSLEFNTYAVKAQIGGIGAQHMGYIEVNADTAVGLDLPQLLRLQSEAPTAPDYVKMIEEWLSEAKAAADKATAEAAIAKTQADRAKNEADRASEISGLNTVADAIGLAAVPFPDVWIPFNDSLRMIAGFGRDVKVGADVVATYANYERATTATYIDKSGMPRTAAINEPRFEKQGLLIEGQSTNFTFPSEGWKPSANASEPWVHSHADTYGFITVSGSGSPSANEGSYKDFSVPKTGTPCTFSMDIAKSESLNVCIRAYGVGGEVSGAVDISITPAGVSGAGASSVRDAGNYWRVEVTRTFTGNTRLLRIYPFGASVGSSGSMGYRRTQLEELPFASSYIPTSGSAVTRAADKLWINTSNNALNLGITIAASVYIETAGANATNARRYVVSAGDNSLNNCISIQGSNTVIGKWFYTGNSVVTTEVTKRSSVLAVVTSGSESCAWVDGVKATASASGAPVAIDSSICIGGRLNSTGVLFGHIRNFRVWHSALSDAQIKGLK